MTSIWPFFQRGMGFLGPFPLAQGQLKFLIVGFNYFTKWIEGEAVTKITTEKVWCFYWHKIICLYGLPEAIVSDEIQFASAMVTDFCKDLGMQTKFMFMVHPQANSRYELTNKVILKEIKKKLDETKVL